MSAPRNDENHDTSPGDGPAPAAAGRTGVALRTKRAIWGAIVVVLVALIGVGAWTQHEATTVGGGEVRATGQVVELNEYEGRSRKTGRHQTWCSPVAEFTSQGQTYRTPRGGHSTDCPVVGEDVEVIFDPNDPGATSRLPDFASWSGLLTGSIALVIVGAAGWCQRQRRSAC